MKRLFLVCAGLMAGLFLCGTDVKGQTKGQESRQPAKVYMMKDINAQNLVKIYEALGREATGKVAVKLSTGEPGNNNYLNPMLIKDLVQKVDGMIVECNTAYGGGRSNTESHLKAAEDHGFTAIAPVVIMDAEGEASLPVKNGRWLPDGCTVISTSGAPLPQSVLKMGRCSPSMGVSPISHLFKTICFSICPNGQ